MNSRSVRLRRERHDLERRGTKESGRTIKAVEDPRSSFLRTVAGAAASILMMIAGVKMLRIESISGDSIAEAFYQAFGLLVIGVGIAVFGAMVAPHLEDLISFGLPDEPSRTSTEPSARSGAAASTPTTQAPPTSHREQHLSSFRITATRWPERLSIIRNRSQW